MCLERKGTFKPCKVGYKVMKLKEGKLCGEFEHQAGKERKKEVWLNEEDFRPYWYHHSNLLTGRNGSDYSFGWHVFHTYEDAVAWGLDGGRLVVVKVSVREPKCVGYQACLRVTVAKWIKITKASKVAFS